MSDAQGEAASINRYERIEKLGEGGMGVVWKARDRELGRFVALKLLRSSEPGDVQRLQREARIAAGLRHPNIVTIHDIGTTADGAYLSMDFINGRPLDQSGLSLNQGLAAIRDAARAVHHAHAQGIIHRDLKPQNIMIDTTGRVFVMDFGLARQSSAPSSLSITGTLLGTPQYMSPEQATGQVSAISPRSDVWGLGATLYHIATGRPPFDGETVYDIALKLAQSDPTAPRDLNPAVHADVQTIILKCLERSPDRRYGSAAELADDLDRFLEGAPISARPPSFVYRIRKFISHRRTLVTSLTVALLSAGFVGALYLNTSRDAAEKDRDLSRLQDAAGRESRLRPLLRRAELLQVESLKGRLSSSPVATWRARLNEASEIIDDVLTSDPDWAPAWIERARVRFELEDLAGAIRDSTEALRISPGDSVARFVRGRARLEEMMRQSLLTLDEDDPDVLTLNQSRQAAQEDFSEGARSGGMLEQEELQLLEVLSLYTAMDYAQAEVRARALLDLHPTDGRLWRVYGDALFRSHKVDEAERAYDEALRFGAIRSIVHLMRGRLRGLRGDDPGQIDDCSRALELDPGLGIAFHNRGMARSRLGLKRESVGDFGRTLELLPDFTNALLQRGADRIDLQELDSARRDFERLLTLQPGHTRGRNLLGRCLQLQGETDAALKEYDRVIEIDPAHADAWNNRGAILAERQDHEAALEALNHALESNPRHADALNNRASIHARQGDWNSAIRDFTSAIEVDAGQASYFANRGWSYMNLAREREGPERVKALHDAAEDFESFLKLAPDDDFAPTARRFIETLRDGKVP